MSTPILGVRYAFNAGTREWVAPGRAALRATGDREDLVPGDYFPDANTTGHITPQSQLEVVTATFTASTAGATYERRWFRNFVSVTAPGVTFRDCLFTGGSGGTTSRAIVSCTNANAIGTLFEDVTVRPDAPYSGLHAIQGHDMTVRRANISRTVDGLSPTVVIGEINVNVLLEGSWLHDLVYFSPDSFQSDNQTHNDIIQWHGGRLLTIRGNRLESFYDPAIGDATKPSVDSGTTHVSGNKYYPSMMGTSVLMVSNISGRTLNGGLLVEKNWINGGAVGLNLAAAPNAFAASDPAIVRDNWFGDDYRLGNDFGVMAKSTQAVQLTGNHRWNADSPFNQSIAFNVRKNG